MHPVTSRLGKHHDCNVSACHLFLCVSWRSKPVAKLVFVNVINPSLQSTSMTIVVGRLMHRIHCPTSSFIHHKESSKALAHTVRFSRSISRRCGSLSTVALHVDSSAFGALHRRYVLPAIAIGCSFAPTPRIGAAIVDEEVAERVFAATGLHLLYDTIAGRQGVTLKRNGARMLHLSFCIGGDQR